MGDPKTHNGFFSLGSKCSSAKYCGHIYANVSAYLWYGTVLGTVLGYKPYSTKPIGATVRTGSVAPVSVVKLPELKK
jgi:hypothetical protein